MKKIVSIISIIIIIVVIIFAIQKNKVPSIENTPVIQNDEQTENTTQETESQSQSEFIITYDGDKFTPETATIQKGTLVIFNNESDKPMWIGSDNHPTHTLYPESNITKCFNGENKALIFDQCANGENYTFTFTQVGSWGYHNHSNPRATGTIVVTE
jgi:uncharacterized protein YxeA